jgi:hypothetical protein
MMYLVVYEVVVNPTSILSRETRFAVDQQGGLSPTNHNLGAHGTLPVSSLLFLGNLYLSAMIRDIRIAVYSLAAQTLPTTAWLVPPNAVD